jgi:peptidoglycan/LPS O-acetylase OafA/YrhL
MIGPVATANAIGEEAACGESVDGISTARAHGTPVDERRNNFDLIRLLAAAQVIIYHGTLHLNLGWPLWAVDFLDRFPGGPVFFVTSGFLVSRSLERSGSLKRYARNRVLRIYPALIVCLAVSIGSVVASGYFASTHVSLRAMWTWIAAQTTIAQFYRPPFLDRYATGTLNGSLWTIPVEIQFYILLPLLYATVRRIGRNSRYASALIVALILGGIAINVWRYGVPMASSNSIESRFLKMSVAPYAYMFLLGVIAQQNFTVVRRFNTRTAGYGVAGYVGVSYLSSIVGLRATENGLNPISVVVLTGLILSAAFTAPELAGRLLRRRDISYGLYIYHMPVINVLVVLGMSGNLSLALALALTTLCATASWVCVERPALRLKSSSSLAGRSVGPAW